MLGRIPTIVFCAFLFASGALAAEDNADTPLMTAAYRGDVSAMREIIAQGADVNATNRVGWTALHFAAGATPIRDQVYRGSPEAATLLLDKGADPNAAGRLGHRPLMLAAMNGDGETAARPPRRSERADHDRRLGALPGGPPRQGRGRGVARRAGRRSERAAVRQR